MLQSIFDSTTIGLLEKMAVFAERRQNVLAGNIANIDTPNYKTRDLPIVAFQEALEKAVAHRHQSPSLGNVVSSRSPGKQSLDDLFPEELFQATQSPADNITFHDANNRSIEKQVTEMTKNAMMQNFAIETMVAQMNLLLAVISERP